jgi:flagellar protein FlgJ
MSSSANFYADPVGLAALKKGAVEQDPKALREAARQFESIFTQMMLKSMRDANKSFASTDSPLSGGEQTDFYREMFDNQIAMQLSKGKGLGLADVLVKQMQALGGKKADGSDAKPLVPTAFPLHRDSATGTTSGVIEKSGIDHSNRETPKDLAMPLRSTSGTAMTSRPSDGAACPEVGAPAEDQETRSTIQNASPISGLAVTPKEFVAQLWPHAEAVGKELGVDPHTLIAQAALETGWGKNVPVKADGTCSFNLFGIKASGRWSGASVGVNTLEFENGVAKPRIASFRAYDSPADSFRDYAALIKNTPRYAAALKSGTDTSAFARALQQGGYATDPNYSTKLVAVADRLKNSLKGDAIRPLTSGRSPSIESVGGKT